MIWFGYRQRNYLVLVLRTIYLGSSAYIPPSAEKRIREPHVGVSGLNVET